MEKYKYWSQINKEIVDKYFKILPRQQNKKICVLDAGCGEGIFSKFLTRYNSKLKIEAVDLNPCVPKSLSKKIYVKKNNLINNSLFQQNTFDLAALVGVLHYQPKSLQIKILHNINSWLKTDGVMILVVFNTAEKTNYPKLIRKIDQFKQNKRTFTTLPFNFYYQILKKQLGLKIMYSQNSPITINIKTMAKRYSLPIPILKPLWYKYFSKKKTIKVYHLILFAKKTK